MAGWNATTSRSVVQVCDPEQMEFLEYQMAGNVMCFRSVEENMKIPGSVVDLSGYHFPPKPGSDLGPWNCNRRYF